MDVPPPLNRVYHLVWWQQAFAVVFLLFSVVLALTVGSSSVMNEDTAQPIKLVISILFPLAGLGMATFSFTTTVAFTADCVRKHSVFGDRSLPLRAIRGRRESLVRDNEGGSTRYLQIVPEDDRLRPLKFMKSYDFDDAFFQWFYALRDLDAESRARP